MRASEKQLLEAIQAGYDTTPKLIKHLKRSNHWICKHAKFLQDLGLIHIEKTISKPNIYREVSTYAIPAHDPFGLCRALRATQATDPSVLPSTTSKQLGERRRHRLDDAEDNDGTGDINLGVACVEYGKPRELRDII